MGSGFLFHVFAERDFPCLVDADGIRTNNSLHHSLHMLNYFMWETWMLGGMVLSPCYYKQCSNILFTCLCSLQGPLSWRCLHWWKAQKVRQARITHPQPTDQMANKHQERRKGFLHNAHLPGSNSAAQELLYPMGSLDGTLMLSNSDIFQKLYPDQSCAALNKQYICFELPWQFLILLLLPLILLQVLTIQNASIVVSDIPASNGIIHVLNKVCQYMRYWEVLHL